ncbi:hypothetical protein H4R18_003212 [Coemansia javaensis]|uniref:Uncharacterized protein n=1 Tax=Coemansia javaensis TaxID=2761396 RepID=A0A9W8HB03_9FUNG|nr:hypothetical protein H4R18_003212 [Coemansia javaensis]
MTNLQGATVKLAVSGDSLVLRGVQRGNQPPPERTLGLAFISAPRLGNPKKDIADEAFSFESREYLRRRTAGKAVKFVVRYKTAGGREYGSVYLGPDLAADDVSIKLVQEGWARVTDQARSKIHRSDAGADDVDLIERLMDAEEQAKSGKRGMWDPKAKPSRPRLTTFEGDARKFLDQHKGRELRATVEQVRDATTLRVMLHLPDAHQLVTLLMAGVKGPVVRTNVPGQPDHVEPFGEEAKFNVEIRLLQQDIKVKLEALPQGPAASGTFAGNVIHSAGNIANWLVSNSFAKVADWSASFATGGAAALRQLEREAKAKRMRVWRNFTGAVDQVPRAAAAEATVVRVVSGDTVIVRDDVAGEDREYQLASIRQPRASDPDQAGYAEQARESLRRLCIGKPVSVTVDYHKPATETFRARVCATIRYKGTDLGVHLVKGGLAGVLRHRADDDNRSSNYDELLAAEAHAQEAKVGIHSGKPKAATKPVDASESAARARSFITHWQRTGRVPCVVEYINAGARLRLYMPKENVKLMFVLGGVRCARAPRSDGTGGEPTGAEALAFTMWHAMQRNVEVEFEGVDKAGAFIGTLWLGKEHSLAESLLEQGLASVFEASAEHSPHKARLYAAERSAKAARRGIWVDYDAEAEARSAAEKAKAEEQARQASAAARELKPRIEFLDVVVSELASPAALFVQLAAPAKVAELEAMMAELGTAQPAAQSGFAPKQGQLVSACYTAGDQWHRARIVKALPGKQYEVLYVDFGNAETVSADRIRPLPAKFAAAEPYAHPAQLAFLRLPSDEFASDYTADTYAALRQLVEGRPLVANVEARLPGGQMQLTLYDPALGRPVLEKSVNGEIAAAGYAVADDRALASRHNAAAAAKMAELVAEARAARRGIWEYGDITTDD